MSTFKVVTFNLRYDCKEDNEQRFEYRKPIIIKKINDQKPDIIGFQEVLPHMMAWLKETFTDYIIVGTGRGQDYQNEHNPIAFKKERFELFELDTFWLSPTPHIPGSRFEVQSMCPRICTVVTLKPQELKQPIRFYNTHLDHESSLARQLGMSMVLQRINEDYKKYPLPVILTGDFNATPEAEEIVQISEAKLKDCTTDIAYTFHEFGNETLFCKIDYIFVSKEVKNQGASVWEDKVDGIYISDHYPVEAKLVISIDE